MGEDHPEECYGGVDDRHAQRKRAWDGLPHRDAQVDGGGVMLQGPTPRRAVGLQLEAT